MKMLFGKHRRPRKPMPLQDVVDGGLCSGCGVCAYLQPNEIRMTDVPDQGLRPIPIRPGATTLPDGLGARACPGSELSIEPEEFSDDTIEELRAGWGPIRAIWEGHAVDPEIRFSGSSGGVASALALFAVEQHAYDGVLHVGARKDAPYLNETVVSRTREELLARTGSRYAPASPCDGLAEIENAPESMVFIGKPCDVAATRKARALRPNLDEKLGLTIAFFCAGTPSTNGTQEMLAQLGVSNLGSLRSLRYRGNGWPGRATAVFVDENGSEKRSDLSYGESWGSILSKHVQWRCRLCADHTGEFADIAVGDPWYREIEPGEAGSSLILARSERGKAFLREAIASGYISAAESKPDSLPRSQHHLMKARGAIWGRILGLRMIGARAPRLFGMDTVRLWRRELTMKEKAKSVLGTIRRCLQRGLHPSLGTRRQSVKTGRQT